MAVNVEALTRFFRSYDFAAVDAMFATAKRCAVGRNKRRWREKVAARVDWIDRRKLKRLDA